MEKLKRTETTRADAHAAFMEKVSPELIAKVSRVVSQRRATFAAMQAAAEQYSEARKEIQRLEGERERITVSGLREGAVDIKIIDQRIHAAQHQLARLKTEQDRLSEPSRIATTIAHGVLKALEKELGGGTYQSELFETMGWR